MYHPTLRLPLFGATMIAGLHPSGSLEPLSLTAGGGNTRNRCQMGFTWETTMKDVRGQQQAERQYNNRPRVRCVVCGLHYLTRDKKGWTCSKKCAERLKETPNEN
jgi:hypothetical protein